MAARKLQTEIDRTFKRVAEGIAVFESIYEKLNSSSNKAQNEKIEQDLKKEIKKLQRYRDQIKTWASSNDIKDKKPLLDHRRLIEVQMEKFKACEKEIKTKQYSKEGLNAAAKLDPKEREKMEMCQWLSQSVDELERQVEQAEAEIELLSAQVKKGKKDTSKSERLEEVEHLIERHKWHTDKLEQILRLVENGGLEVDQVAAIKDDVQYYVDSNQDVDFAEDENIYDELELGENSATDDEDDSVSDKEETSTPIPAPAPIPVAAPVQKTPEINKAKPVPRKVAEPPKPAAAPVKAPIVTKIAPAKPSVPALSSAAQDSPNRPTGPTIQEERKEEQKRPAPTVLKYANAAATGANIRESQPRIEKLPAPSVAPTASPTLMSTTLGRIVSPVVSSPRPSAPTRSDSVAHTGASTPVTQELQQPNYHIPACLADIIPEEHTLTEEERNRMLESSYKTIPREVDGERPNHYVPQEPYPTPPYYPSVPLDLFSEPEAMEKMDIDTLFYIFYYQKGTYQQYLASRELKKQAWRFHKRYLTWFQRHEEPKVITDEYESGTYRYFDFEASWVQRKKSDFKFQYEYLEDGTS